MLDAGGNFLIRESRNVNNAYTLSLYFQGKVMNYRIIYEEDTGYSFQDPESTSEEPAPSHQSFPTLIELVAHHKEVAVCICMYC